MPRKQRESKTSSPAPSAAGAAQDFEKLGVLYLGRRYDSASKAATPELVLYDSKDLVTHAVCVGMTGSGKTGLCIGLLEEAAIDGIPAIIIDPKGDLANLLLTFPRLESRDFAPWINEDDARKKGVSPEAYATAQAMMWKKGLAEWGQDGARIQAFQDAADCVVYTPGSSAGIPLSILKSFAAPPEGIRTDAELLRERIGSTVTSLLGLVGVQADPIRSREHILLSTILDRTWTKGVDLDLAGLIEQIQVPPVAKIGILDLDTFFPSKERFALAMQLNNLLAAPGFSSWLEGEPLDVETMLHSPAGKPRLAICSIAHLNDAERMFFVTLLLSQVLSWVRTQSGTTSLRAILYMDEIAGYFPPVANPPSKAPLLTLLKQARAFGLGVVLATQNPVDLDYKGLANAGTWFIGRLQTDRDKARVLEGLEGAAASGGKRYDRRQMEQTLAGLGNRVFLMNNVHEDAPELFQTRWTLSYLRGPLTRTQIKTLMEPMKRKASGVKGKENRDVASPHPSPLSPDVSRPMLPPDVPQHFLPVRSPQPNDTRLVYMPLVLAMAEVHVRDAKSGVDTADRVVLLAPVTEGAVAVDWGHAAKAAVAIEDLEQDPAQGARFGSLPAAAGKEKNYQVWKQDFSGWLYRSQRIQLWRSPLAKQVSRPGESERDFRIRLQQDGREHRDRAADGLRQKYAPRIAALQDRIRRAEQMVERQTAESRSSQLQAAISVGATILGAFLGRKSISATTVGRAATAIRGAGRAMKESKDVSQAQDNAAALQEQLAALETQFKREADAATLATDPLSEKLEVIVFKPTKADISVTLITLAWTPYWQDSQGNLVKAHG